MSGRAQATTARTYLGFDYGTRRIGVAIGQDVTRTASAIATLSSPHGRIDWDAITKLVETWQPAGFVLGRPQSADGAALPLVVAIERFARRLTGRYARPVAFVDERLSSYAAGRAVAAPARGLDAAAACVILETWLNEQYERGPR